MPNNDITDRSAAMVTSQIAVRMRVHDSEIRDLIDCCVKAAMNAAYQNVIVRSAVKGVDITIALSDVRQLVERDT